MPNKNEAKCRVCRDAVLPLVVLDKPWQDKDDASQYFYGYCQACNAFTELKDANPEQSFFDDSDFDGFEGSRAIRPNDKEFAPLVTQLIERAVLQQIKIEE